MASKRVSSSAGTGSRKVPRTSPRSANAGRAEADERNRVVRGALDPPDADLSSVEPSQPYSGGITSRTMVTRESSSGAAPRRSSSTTSTTGTGDAPRRGRSVNAVSTTSHSGDINEEAREPSTLAASGSNAATLLPPPQSGDQVSGSQNQPVTTCDPGPPQSMPGSSVSVPSRTPLGTPAAGQRAQPIGGRREPPLGALDYGPRPLIPQVPVLDPSLISDAEFRVALAQRLRSNGFHWDGIDAIPAGVFNSGGVATRVPVEPDNDLQTAGLARPQSSWSDPLPPAAPGTLPTLRESSHQGVSSTVGRNGGVNSIPVSGGPLVHRDSGATATSTTSSTRNEGNSRPAPLRFVPTFVGSQLRNSGERSHSVVVDEILEEVTITDEHTGRVFRGNSQFQPMPPPRGAPSVRFAPQSGDQGNTPVRSTYTDCTPSFSQSVTHSTTADPSRETVSPTESDRNCRPRGDPRGEHFVNLLDPYLDASEDQVQALVATIRATTTLDTLHDVEQFREWSGCLYMSRLGDIRSGDWLVALGERLPRHQRLTDDPILQPLFARQWWALEVEEFDYLNNQIRVQVIGLLAPSDAHAQHNTPLWHESGVGDRLCFGFRSLSEAMVPRISPEWQARLNGQEPEYRANPQMHRQDHSPSDGRESGSGARNPPAQAGTRTTIAGTMCDDDCVGGVLDETEQELEHLGVSTLTTGTPKTQGFWFPDRDGNLHLTDKRTNWQHILDLSPLYRLLEAEVVEDLIPMASYDESHIYEYFRNYNTPFAVQAESVDRRVTMATIETRAVIKDEAIFHRFLKCHWKRGDRNFLCLEHFGNIGTPSVVLGDSPSLQGRSTIAYRIRGVRLVMQVIWGSTLSQEWLRVEDSLFSEDSRFGLVADQIVESLLEEVLFMWCQDVRLKKVSARCNDHSLADITQCGQVLGLYINWFMTHDAHAITPFAHQKYYAEEGYYHQILKFKKGSGPAAPKSQKPQSSSTASGGARSTGTKKKWEKRDNSETRTKDVSADDKTCLFHTASLLEVKDSKDEIYHCHKGTECPYKHYTAKKDVPKAEFVKMVKSPRFCPKAIKEAFQNQS